MSFLKRRKLLFFVIVCAMLLAGGYAVLSGRTFYAQLVADKVAAAFEDAGGYSLSIRTLKGNPITGVSGEGVSVSHQGAQIASADEIVLKLNLATLLSSPRLSRLELSNLRLDYETVLRHLPEGSQESAAAPALERLVLTNSDVKTPWGGVSIDRSAIELGQGRYRVNFRGAFRDEPLALQADIATSDNTLELRSFEGKWSDAVVGVAGTVQPRFDLYVNAKDLDVDRFADLVPTLADLPIGGRYSGKFTIRGGKSLSVSGNLDASDGHLWQVPFASLTAGLSYADDTLVAKNIRAGILGGIVSGDVSAAMQKGKQPQLDLRFEIDSVEPKRLAPVLAWANEVEGTLDGAVCSVKGTPQTLAGTAELKTAKLKVYGYDISDISLKAQLNGKSPAALSFKAKALGAEIAGNGKLTLPPKPTLDFGIEMIPFSLAELGKSFPQVGASGISGVGKSSMKIAGPVDGLLFSGSLEFPALSVREQYKFDDAKASFTYSKEGLSLSGAQVRFRDALITAEDGSRTNLLEGVEKLDFKGEFSDAKIEHFGDLAPIIKERNIKGTFSGTWKLEGELKSPSLEVALKVPKLDVDNNLSFGNIAGSALYRDAQVELKELSARMGAAKANASGVVTLPQENKTLSYNVKGSFADLDPENFVKAGLLSADVSGDLTGDFRVWLDKGADAPSTRVYLKNSRLIYSNLFDISEIKGAITLAGGDLKFEKLRTQINTGYINVDGTVGGVLAEKASLEKMPLDLSVNVMSADIGRISRLFLPMTKGYQGMLSGSAVVRGTAAAPSFKGEAMLRGVRAFGIFLPVVRAKNISGNLREIKLPNVEAVVGRGAIRAHASMTHTEDWRLSAEATGRSVDIRSLTSALDDEVRRDLNGALDFDFKGSGWLDSFEGTGEARIDSLTAMGLHITDIKAPFYVTDGFVLVEDSSAKLYGGVANAQVAKDLKMSNWGGRINIQSMDVKPAFADFMPDSEGNVSGTVNASVRMAGDSTRTSMRDGSGNVDLTDAEISGFPGVAAVSKLIGNRPIRFQAANLSFSIDGRTFYILPGSRVAAPAGDPVFRYVMADGSIALENKKMDISCYGNVNIRALNSFVGGVQGLISAAMENTNDTDLLLQNFLSGAISGFSKNEFRDVSLEIRSKSDDIAIEHIKIANPVQFDSKPQGLDDPSGIKEKKQERIQLKFEIPVGPGGNSNSSNVGGQVGGQVLEQALKGILNFDR